MFTKKTKAALAEELKEKNRHICQLQEDLNERNQKESSYRAEVSRLAHTFQRARIRAWFWAEGARSTQYLPVGGDARASQGESVGESPFTENRLLQAVHPEDRGRLALVWDRVHGDHSAYEIEYRVVEPDGRICHQHEVGTPEYSETGSYLGHIGTTQDITEPKLVEEALEQCAHRLNEAEHIAKIGHWKWDEEGYRLLSCSEQAAAIFGLSAEKFLASVRP